MNIPQRFWKWADSYYGENVDLVDIEALYDSAITVEENITLFKAHCPVTTVVPEKKVVRTYDETPRETIQHKKKIDLDSVRFIAIIGDRQTAKSNLMFKYMNEYEGERQKYVYGYPKPVDGCITITNKTDLYSLRNGIVFMDELQKHFKFYDKRANEELMEFMAMAEHSNVTVVATTPMSQFITKGVEGAVDVWNLTRIKDLASLKNGSKPKRIVQQTSHPSCTRYSLSLQNGEYLQYGEFLGAEMNGVKTFSNQNVGKEW